MILELERSQNLGCLLFYSKLGPAGKVVQHTLCCSCFPRSYGTCTSSVPGESIWIILLAFSLHFLIIIPNLPSRYPGPPKIICIPNFYIRTASKHCSSTQHCSYCSSSVLFRPSHDISLPTEWVLRHQLWGGCGQREEIGGWGCCYRQRMKSENRVTLIHSCIITHYVCVIPPWTCDCWSFCPTQNLAPGGLASSHGRAFSTPHGVSTHCCVTPLPTHILPKVTQQDLTGTAAACPHSEATNHQRSDSQYFQDPQVPTLPDTLVRAPRYLDSSWHCNSDRGFGILYAEALSLLKPHFFPCHRVCPFCAPLCHKNTKAV